MWARSLAAKAESELVQPEPEPSAHRRRSACRAGAAVLLVGFWFDGGLFRLATAATFWILLELGQGRHGLHGFPRMSEDYLTAENARAQRSHAADFAPTAYDWRRFGLLLPAFCFSFSPARCSGHGDGTRFRRAWFTVRTPGQGKAQCVAILPKMAVRPLPVVVWLHGSGGSVTGSGNEMRQMAEMGLAVVGMDYCQTNETVFEAQFTALADYLGRQRWVDTNRVAWVGYSLGAQRLLSFALRHPERQPTMLVRLAGGRVPEMEGLKVQPAFVGLPPPSDYGRDKSARSRV